MPEFQTINLGRPGSNSTERQAADPRSEFGFEFPFQLLQKSRVVGPRGSLEIVKFRPQHVHQTIRREHPAIKTGSEQGHGVMCHFPASFLDYQLFTVQEKEKVIRLAQECQLLAFQRGITSALKSFS